MGVQEHEMTVEDVLEFIIDNYEPSDLVVRLGLDIETLVEELEHHIRDQKESFFEEM